MNITTNNSAVPRLLFQNSTSGTSCVMPPGGVRTSDRSRCRFCSIIGLALALGLLSVEPAQALDRTWIGGNVDWIDGGSTANWSPADEPDSDDTAIFNTANTVSLGSGNSILALTMSGGIDLFTGGHSLSVGSQTTLDGASTTLRIESNTVPATISFEALNLDLNTGGALVMIGGIATVNAQLEINAGSFLSGFGLINVGDLDVVAEQAFENSGLIQVVGNTAAPQTLTIRANGVDTIDLDGDTEVGVVDVANASANVNADTLTLIIDGPLTDSFGTLAGAALQIGQRDTLTFTENFQIAANTTVDLNGGNNVATLNGAGDITSIAGATFTVAGSALIANDMTFSGTANSVTTASSSTLTLGGTVAVPDASMFVFGTSSSFVVSGATTITEAAGDFDWDGGGAVTTTVQGAGLLTLSVNHVDLGSDIFNGTLNLNDNGDVAVNVTPGSWTMAGTVNKNNAGTSSVSGDAVNLTGAVHVNAGTLAFPTTTLSPSSTLDIAGLMTLGGASVIAGPAAVTGPGTLRFSGTSTVTANTTIAVNTFDWDGVGTGTLHSIGSGVNFTINSPNLDTDGDMDDPINLAGDDGTITVNGPASWEMRGAFNANSTGSGSAHIAGNARMIMVGTSAIMTVNGQTFAEAPLTLSTNSVVNIASTSLRLSGGDAVSVFNQITGGSINGPGTLAMATGRELRGFGTNNAPIDFDGTGSLRANDGTLIVNGAIIDVGTIGTADGDGILDVANAWNSSIAANVVLNGGELKGGTLTIGNVNGVVGHGLLSSRVINNQKIGASGGTLIVQTVADDNDWDGAGNAGRLEASGGGTLELHDTGAAFGFAGVVSASGGSRVSSTNFALDFNPGSALNLTASRYESSSSTDVGGAVNISPGGESIIQVRNNFFLSFEPTSVTTLGANLRLVNNNINIEAGATFSGSGALIVPDGSHLVIDDGANINALLNLQGALRPANFEGIGRVDVKDFQEAETSELFIEIAGTALNEYDRLVVNGAAVLNGYLNLDMDAGFVPVLGNTFNIISASGGISGHFTAADITGVPNGLTFQINYLPNAIQVSVVAGGSYETWISLFPALTNPADRLKDADPDGDRVKNYAEFAFDGDPSNAAESGTVVAKIAPVAGINVLTLTFAARFSFLLPSDPAGNEFVFNSAFDDATTYTIRAGDEVTTDTLNVTEVTGADAAAIRAGLPPLSPNWVYRTFRCPDSVVGNPADFMRVIISD